MVTPDSSPYSPSEKWSIIEEGDLPELDKEFTKSPKTLGKTDVQIAHVNDEGTWAHGRSGGTSERATCTSPRTPLATTSPLLSHALEPVRAHKVLGGPQGQAVAGEHRREGGEEGQAQGQAQRGLVGRRPQLIAIVRFARA